LLSLTISYQYNKYFEVIQSGVEGLYTLPLCIFTYYPNMSTSSPFNSWLWQMAWRDSRKSRQRLLLFMSSIMLGIAALVAINSFAINLERSIDDQAKELLGADLVLNTNKPVSAEAQVLIDSIGRERSEEHSFASMVFFPKNSGTRLIQVKALKGNFPILV
jgi:putative ABC transport system permease protein